MAITASDALEDLFPLIEQVDDDHVPEELGREGLGHGVGPSSEAAASPARSRLDRGQSLAPVRGV